MAAIGKWFVRGVLACLALVGMLVAAVAFACYLAFETPAFYTELSAKQYTDADRDATELWFRQHEAKLNQWVAKSLARQREAILAGKPQVAERPRVLPATYDPDKDVYALHITQQQINEQLASAKYRKTGDMQEPRVMISEGHLVFGCQMVNKDFSCVVSTSLTPSLNEQGDLQLSIHSASIGQLPLPIKTIAKHLPPNLVQPNADLSLDLTAEVPTVTFRVNKGAGDYPARTKSIQCREGELVIEFLPPLLKVPQPQGLAANAAR